MALAPLFVWGPLSAAARVAMTVTGLGIALVAPGPVVRRIGGMTGDVAGATILLTETAVLAMAAVAAAAAATVAGGVA